QFLIVLAHLGNLLRRRCAVFVLVLHYHHESHFLFLSLAVPWGNGEHRPRPVVAYLALAASRSFCSWSMSAGSTPLSFQSEASKTLRISSSSPSSKRTSRISSVASPMTSSLDLTSTSQ